MKKYFEIIKKNQLFNKVEIKDYEKMFEYLESYKKQYLKNEIILLNGNNVEFIGIILDGSVDIVKEDVNGEENILNTMETGELFGEVFVCAGGIESSVSAIASKNSEILFIKYSKIFNENSIKSDFIIKLLENMLKIIAKKTLYLNQKIEIISKKKIRDKIMCYLYFESNGREKFTVNFNRQQLANYICAERSAVSKELSKMQKEGLIKYYKKEFEILLTDKI